ncbi:LysR family transcriptional regulator [Bacillus massiliigorillae]|uniref:LysR family transcriptional regulator n=1 Tax=Bacillus massiliigorillae TaxID=1243664 RepID=UPI0003A924C3|nr:LysR family transcriptional regulator [Bacillus massiliigorillae]
MELRNLKAFKVAAEYLNLTKAAEHLGYTQPTITFQIKALEKEIGHPLFTRIGKQTFLTPTGQLLKQHVDKIFKSLEEMEEDLKRLDENYEKLIIASPEFYCSHYLSSILHSYLKLYPNGEISLKSCNSIEVAKMICSNQADIGIIAGMCDIPEIQSEVIESEDLVLVVSTEVLQKHDKSYIMNNLPFLNDKSIDPIKSQLQLFSDLNYNPKTIIECNSEETIKRAVVNRTGIGILGSAIIKEEIKNGSLSILHQFPKKLDTSIIYLKDRSQEAVIQTFLQLVKEIWHTFGE